MKASQVVAPKRAPAKEKPDLEEALEESEDEAVDDADAKEPENDDADLAKDKYVKLAKKPAAKSKAASKSKATKTAKDR